MWQSYIIRGSILEERKQKYLTGWKKGIDYLISKTRAVSRLGRGRKNRRLCLVEGSETIEHGGDSLTQVSLTYCR